jgi:hypothetical protein
MKYAVEIGSDAVQNFIKIGLDIQKVNERRGFLSHTDNKVTL